MNIGKKLIDLRKMSGMSQEEVAFKLSVSRQTVSKWETDQTLPDFENVKELCKLYCISYESLFSENWENLTGIESIVSEIDWTSAWSKKYPILANYQGINGIKKYAEKISQIYFEFKNEFEMTNENTILVLKDILYKIYKDENCKAKNSN